MSARASSSSLFAARAAIRSFATTCDAASIFCSETSLSTSFHEGALAISDLEGGLGGAASEGFAIPNAAIMRNSANEDRVRMGWFMGASLDARTRGR